ncbi:hypothetical protein J6590_062436 [Homalodisca vitripennis]|nr:hypothetical protein J6590_062436 [Homalodisca vitripennis]
MGAVDELVYQALYFFENRLFAQSTLCDMSRAFDTACHADSLSKLDHYGIHGAALSLFSPIFLTVGRGSVLVDSGHRILSLMFPRWVRRLSQDNQIKQRRAWLLLGQVTAERSCPCKRPACPAIGGGSEVTFKPLVPRLSVREGFLALTSPDGLDKDKYRLQLARVQLQAAESSAYHVVSESAILIFTGVILQVLGNKGKCFTSGKVEDHNHIYSTSKRDRNTYSKTLDCAIL